MSLRLVGGYFKIKVADKLYETETPLTTTQKNAASYPETAPLLSTGSVGDSNSASECGGRAELPDATHRQEGWSFWKDAAMLISS